MARDRVSLDLPDLSSFAPRSAPPPPLDKVAVDDAAAKAGFSARHATAPESVHTEAPAKFDARSLRRSNRKVQLNMAVSEDTKRRFWEMAQRRGMTAGEELLIAALDALERQS